eukprot:sb/3471096/
MNTVLLAIISLTLQGIVWAVDCTSDKITISVDQIKDLKTGNNLPSTFKDGDTYTVACKYPATQVFTNDVRGQYGVDQGAIDAFRDGSQAGVVVVGCKSGYAPEMYQLGQFSTRCLSSGFSPSLSNMVKCTAGCSDITAQVANARVVAEKSAIEGAPPFNVGSVATIDCSKGYTIQGREHVTHPETHVIPY